MKNYRLLLPALGGLLVLVPACGSGSGSGSGDMDLNTVSNGFGQVLPHTVFQLDEAGLPTQLLISIRSNETLIENVTLTNPVQPVPSFATTAILPNNQAGNHFIYCEFTRDIDIDSVLEASPTAQSANGLTGAISMVALDPTTGDTSIVRARVLVDGRTYAGPTDPSTGLLSLQRWVRYDSGSNSTVALDVDGETPGQGFPGVTSQFQGFEKLVSPRTIVFVADDDGDLSTFDTFPANRQLRLRISTAVRAKNGDQLIRQALACTTVGDDTLRPEVATTPPPINTPVVTPGGGDQDVDPMTTVRIEFTEPVQPLLVGALPDGQAPFLSSSVSLLFGPSTARVNVPFTVLPVSIFDFGTYELTPGFNFPGEFQGAGAEECNQFSRVDIVVNAGQLEDLAVTPNRNLLGAQTFFVTGEGPGLVNAPVIPDTIYVGRSGAVPGISVIDLNGFGQSTGDPTFDPTYQTFAAGRSNFPNNPNVRLQGSLLRPALQPGTCTVNGGSAGVFTLTRDSSLNNLLVRAPLLSSVSDMMIGHALDGAFNNGPAPFGCQANGGNLCAFDGKKRITAIAAGPNTMAPSQQGQFGNISPGSENLVGWGPHPNPPPLIFPPLCVSPYLGGQEPTSINTAAFPPTGSGLTNLLAPGDPFGQPLQGIPPSGLLTPEQNSFFEGPSPEQATIGACLDYQMRQQIGHFLYVIDRGRREIVVINSNRMTVIDRIPLTDPTSLAMSPNLNLLAVTNQLSDVVSFIDIDPNSSTFHQVIEETVVGSRPRGIAWDPGNEDIMVANEGDDSVSVISAAALSVRKVVSSQLDQPFEVAITPRGECWAFSRQVYFGYILNRNGKIAIFESGPNTVNGWGYDDVIGISSQTFIAPKAMQIDQIDLRSGLWIAHEGPIDLQTQTAGNSGVPAVSKIVAYSGITGQLPLNFTSLLIPQFRDLSYSVQISIGAEQLSGLPTDIAFDNMRVLSGMPNLVSSFSAGPPLPINGKGVIRGSCAAGIQNNSEPIYMFVAVPNSVLVGGGVVDVIRIDGSYTRIDTNAFVAGIQSITAGNVQVLADYFRQ